MFSGFSSDISNFIFFVSQCGSLLDTAKIEDFMEDVNEEYEEIREEHYDSIKVKLYSICLCYITKVRDYNFL